MKTQSNTVRICFNQEIDLKDLEKEYEVNTPQFKRWFRERFKGEFEGFVWVDLNQKDPNDPEFTNVDIRDDQNEGLSIEEIQFSYRAIGWMMPPKFGDKFFPLVDLLHEFDDGRTRALAAMEEKERWIPCARIKKPDNSLTSKISTGFCSNLFAPQRSITPSDYVKGTVKLIKAGELKRDLIDIEAFLVTKGNIHKKYPDNAGGWITKIKNMIFEKSAAPTISDVRKLDERQWKKYLKKCVIYGIDGKRLSVNEITFYKVPSRTAEARLLYKILDNTSKERHTYVALYCGGDLDAKQIRLHLNTFMDNTDKTHEKAIVYGNKALGEPLKRENFEDTKQYTFFILPTIIGDDKHDSTYRNYQVFDRDSSF